MHHVADGFILPQLNILGGNHIPVIQPCVWLCICLCFKLLDADWGGGGRGGERILWPGTGDFQVDSNKSSSHSLEPIIGRMLQSHTFTAGPLEWFCFLHFVFTFGDLKHRPGMKDKVSVTLRDNVRCLQTDAGKTQPSHQLHACQVLVEVKKR